MSNLHQLTLRLALTRQLGVVVEPARRLLGEDWLENYVRAAHGGGVERMLL